MKAHISVLPAPAPVSLPASRPVYFFITLHTPGRKHLFRDQSTFKTVAERLWSGVMQPADLLHTEALTVQSNCLYALVRVHPAAHSTASAAAYPETIQPAADAAPSVILERAIALFRTLSQHEWQRLHPGITPECWQRNARVKLLRDAESREATSDFIISQMLECRLPGGVSAHHNDDLEDWDL